MARYLLRVFRAMLVTSLGFGGGMGLLIMIFVITSNHQPNAFKYGLMAGLTFGCIAAIFMVAVLLPLDLSAHVFLSKGRYRQIWELEQTRDIEVSGTGKQVLHAARQALLIVPYVTRVSDDVEHMITRAASGPSWRSGGEEMEVELNPIAENQWKVKVVSRPRSKNALFDYGKNFENVETWIGQFSQLLEASKA